MNDDTTHDPGMLALANDVMAFDSARVGVMIDLLRTTVINARAPQAEILWSLVCVAVAVVRAEPGTRDDRMDRLSVLQHMISLSMGLSESRESTRDADTQVH